MINFFNKHLNINTCIAQKRLKSLGKNFVNRVFVVILYPCELRNSEKKSSLLSYHGFRFS